MNEFRHNQSGMSIQFILILAAIVIVLVYFGSKIMFHSKYTTNEKVVANIDCTMESMSTTDCSDVEYRLPPPGGRPGGGGSSDYLTGGEVFGFIEKVDITTDTKVPPFIYGENDTFRLKAIATPKRDYKLKEPLTCQWTGYVTYTGHSCTSGPEVRFPVGEHELKVKLCDAYGACVNGIRTITVAYQDPLLVMHQEWNNYIKTSGVSGQWRYDEPTNTILSTQNVGWTGYYNPEDVNLQNYTLRFSMGVSPTNDDDALGMTFRMRDLNNMYMLSIDKRDQNGGVSGYHSGLYKFVNGRKTLLVDMIPLKWVGNQYMNVEINVINNHITVYIDGTKRADIYDSSLTNGAYGPFTISQANGRFRNLDVEVYR